MFLVLVLVVTVRCSDIIRLDLDPIDYSPSIYRDRMDTDLGKLKQSDALESEYGVFQRPRFKTQKNRTTIKDNKVVQKVHHVQKIQKFPEDTRTRINSLLKNYLAKIYRQKYKIKRLNEEDQESKFLTNNVWVLNNKTKHFSNKFLSLFTIVQFPNAQCQSSGTGGTYLGTCYHQTECLRLNGTALGECAEGYGVCCVFRYTCGASSSQNCTYFENPGYPDYDPPGSMVLPPSSSTLPPMTTAMPPTPDPRWKYHYRVKRQTDTSLSCSMNIYKQSDNIQQMRIDFIDLELRGPTDGTCEMERLIISGANINNQIPVICGYNTGQHVYVDVSTLMGPLQLSVLSNTGERKRFKIRVCQLAMGCSNNNNCLQYYTGVSGVISTFNYDQAAVNNRSVPGYFVSIKVPENEYIFTNNLTKDHSCVKFVPNNLNYAICIRREAGYCSITYTNMPTDMEYPFQLVNIDDDGESTVPAGQAGAEIAYCPDDYIVIGGVRLCGDKFNDGAIIDDFTENAPITDSGAGPIVIPVRTDEVVTGYGFKLFYTQNRCMGT